MFFEYEVGVLGCEVIQQQALWCLRQIPDFKNELPAVENCSGGNEEAIAHYLECEMREALGETRGCLGWFNHRRKKVRGHLRGLYNTLEGARKRWCDEENAIEAKRRLVDLATVERAFRSEERRKLFEKRWDEVKERCRLELDEGTFEGPIVPIGYKEPEPRVRKDKSDEKVSYLALPDEAAPIPGEVHEGGSSGSGGPALEEPEEPPPAPPPPEAPLSEAGRVRQKLQEGSERLTREAYLELEDQFIAVAKPEDLRLDDMLKYEAVKGAGLGICGRCRWMSGCESCDEVKAWSFACRSTLWHTASEAVRPKAKPRGRPKKAA